MKVQKVFQMNKRIKVKKIVTVISAIVVFVLLIQDSAFAKNYNSKATIQIVCETKKKGENRCTVSPSNTAPLFSSESFPNFDIKPGDKYKRKIYVKNKTKETCNFTLVSVDKKHDTETPIGSGKYFSDELQTKITKGTKVVFGGNNYTSFSNLFSVDNKLLSKIKPSDSETFEWYIYFSPNAGNEYQNAELSFDFTWNFKCNKSGDVHGDNDCRGRNCDNKDERDDDHGRDNRGGQKFYDWGKKFYNYCKSAIEHYYNNYKNNRRPR